MTNLKELVPVRETKLGTPFQRCVSARQLHSFLEVGKDFSTWIKDRIKKYGFVENQDFSPIVGKSNGGRPSTYYALSIDMAKELAMVENNDKGRQARRYFIECEKQLREKAAVPMTSMQMLQQVVNQMVANEQKQLQMDNRLTILEAKTTLKDESYYSISGYARLQKIQISRKDAHKLGIRAGNKSRKNGVLINPIHDAKYGTINSYHISILETIFANFESVQQ